LADNDRKPHRAEKPAAILRRLYGILTQPQVVAAVYILILCAAFFLETRAHRSLFYAFGVPLFLLQLRHFDWHCLKDSAIARMTLIYLGYFLLSALWSDGFSWVGFANLLRVSLLLLLFFVVTLHLSFRNNGFSQHILQSYVATAGASLLAVFAAFAFGLLPSGPRLTGFGLAGQPIIGATLYGVALLVAAFELLPNATGRRLCLLWLTIIALCAAFMVLSSSRGPLLALATALIVGLVIADLRAAATVAALVCIVVAGGVLLEADSIAMLYERAQSGHFEVWQQVVATIAERPWFGYGSLVDLMFQSKYEMVRSPHNLVLANLLYGGIPAVILLAGLLLLALLQAWRTWRTGKPIYVVLLTFAFTASLFDTRSLAQNLGREWITFWLPIALLAAQESLRCQSSTTNRMVSMH
jgi:O-antigen ligase